MQHLDDNKPLPDNYPVHYLYFYKTQDGKIHSSPIEGTVAQLKKELKVSQVYKATASEVRTVISNLKENMPDLGLL